MEQPHQISATTTQQNISPYIPNSALKTNPSPESLTPHKQPLKHNDQLSDSDLHNGSEIPQQNPSIPNPTIKEYESHPYGSIICNGCSLCIDSMGHSTDLLSENNMESSDGTWQSS